MKRRNTQSFTILAWISFIAACIAMYVGIYNLQEPLSVKGYYAVTAAFLIMSSFVLQKTIRDNAEDQEDKAFLKIHSFKKNGQSE